MLEFIWRQRTIFLITVILLVPSGGTGLPYRCVPRHLIQELDGGAVKNVTADRCKNLLEMYLHMYSPCILTGHQSVPMRCCRHGAVSCCSVVWPSDLHVTLIQPSISQTHCIPFRSQNCWSQSQLPVVHRQCTP